MKDLADGKCASTNFGEGEVLKLCIIKAVFGIL